MTLFSVNRGFLLYKVTEIDFIGLFSIDLVVEMVFMRYFMLLKKFEINSDIV